MMKKLIFTIALLMLSMPVATIEAGDSSSVEEQAKESGTMWICGGPKSTKYHKSKTCRGLNRCSKTPKKIALKECKKKGYTACRICAR